MNRQEYLNQLIVNDFVNWIVSKEKNGGNWLEHSYKVSRRNAGRYFNPHYTQNNTYELSSLIDAFDKYYWNSEDFDRNRETLELLQKEIRELIRSEIINNEDILKRCIKIFQWGGINNNTNTIINLRNGTSDQLKNGVQNLSLDQNLDDINYLNDFNSGLTKVYSLLIDDFIIYDSRVGAALGFLVSKFYSDTIREFKPDEFKQLNFPWANAKETGNANAIRKNRNPSTTSELTFPSINGIHKTVRERWQFNNIRSSWLVTEIVNRLNKNNSTDDSNNFQWDSRKFEAALFMIGYTVPPNLSNNQ